MAQLKLDELYKKEVEVSKEELVKKAQEEEVRRGKDDDDCVDGFV